MGSNTLIIWILLRLKTTSALKLSNTFWTRPWNRTANNCQSKSVEKNHSAIEELYRHVAETSFDQVEETRNNLSVWNIDTSYDKISGLHFFDMISPISMYVIINKQSTLNLRINIILYYYYIIIIILYLILLIMRTSLIISVPCHSLQYSMSPKGKTWTTFLKPCRCFGQPCQNEGGYIWPCWPERIFLLDLLHTWCSPLKYWWEMPTNTFTFHIEKVLKSVQD